MSGLTPPEAAVHFGLGATGPSREYEAQKELGSIGFVDITADTSELTLRVVLEVLFGRDYLRALNPFLMQVAGR